MFKSILLISIGSLSLYASSGGESDFVERSINFFIFIAILYYLIADKAKEFFSNRSGEIKVRLEEVQNRLKASKQKRKDAEEALLVAKKTANELVELAKKDAVLISEKISVTINEHITHLDIAQKEVMELKIKTLKQSLVEEILEEILNDKSLVLTEDDIAKKLIKKVA